MIFHNFTGFITLTKREINRFAKVYIQTLLAPLFSNLLFLGIFGTALKDRTVGIGGVDYLHFLIPGLCAMGAIISAFQNPSSSLLIQKFEGSIQDLNSYPITHLEKTLAYVTSGTIRGFIVGLATYAASIPFIGYKIVHPLLFLISLVLISGIFASLGLITGLFSKNFEHISFIVSFVITPLTYFGGVFFQVSNLPGIFRNLIYINPIIPTIDFIRYSFVGLPNEHIFLKVIIVLLIYLFSLGASYYTLKKGVGLVIK